MKFIVAGAGEVGLHIAEKLSEKNRVILIEKDPGKLCRSPGDREMGFDPLHAGRVTGVYTPIVLLTLEYWWK